MALPPLAAQWCCGRAGRRSAMQCWLQDARQLAAANCRRFFTPSLPALNPPPSTPADAVPEFNIFGLQRLLNDLGGLRWAGGA